MNPVVQIFVIYILPSLISLSGILIATRVWLPQQKEKIRLELQSEYEKRFNEKKWKIYLDFTNYLIDALYKGEMWEFDAFHKSGNIHGKPEKKFIEAQNKLDSIIPPLFLIGSDAVIKVLNTWKKDFTWEDVISPIGFKKAFEIVIEMRKDLGYEDTPLSNEELYGLIIPQSNREINPETKRILEELTPPFRKSS